MQRKHAHTHQEMSCDVGKVFANTGLRKLCVNVKVQRWHLNLVISLTAHVLAIKRQSFILPLASFIVSVLSFYRGGTPSNITQGDSKELHFARSPVLPAACVT